MPDIYDLIGRAAERAGVAPVLLTTASTDPDVVLARDAVVYLAATRLGLTPGAIASALGKTRNTISGYLHRARKRAANAHGDFLRAVEDIGQ